MTWKKHILQQIQDAYDNSVIGYGVEIEIFGGSDDGDMICTLDEAICKLYDLSLTHYIVFIDLEVQHDFENNFISIQCFKSTNGETNIDAEVIGKLYDAFKYND